ncbi:hypothetical protein EVAR_32397_1 [Eumeta japonica]|uniref:Uncharacterized protein n=1 Tax=Eumeta variegata TaxID=151549 RepID=A0A4C1VK20_EUMVA|nr:hypothetical protein EVAR_32397_1 [Eumeta japonica]
MRGCITTTESGICMRRGAGDPRGAPCAFLGVGYCKLFHAIEGKSDSSRVVNLKDQVITGFRSAGFARVDIECVPSSLVRKDLVVDPNLVPVFNFGSGTTFDGGH